jgi:DNA-binding protein HU-beta
MSNIITTADLIETIIAARPALDVEGLTEAQAKRAENAVKKEVKAQVDTVIETLVAKILSGDTVRIAGLGTFTTPVRAGREGTNPLTGQPLSVPAARKVSFKAAAGLKDAAKALPLEGADAE